MATNSMSAFIQHLRKTMPVYDRAGLTDGQLLEDYISRRDDAALAALVRRHGPMIWGVCRRVLCNYHDAEDAFQATFLVLVRKAASILPRELVANWLYGVAHQTALKARATAATRKRREKQTATMPEPAAAEQDLWQDLQPLLDQELSRLPDKYRAVVVLCDLEGKTRKEAARQLAVPEGTVAGRLARARMMLAKRLAQRGVTVSGGALAAVVAQKAASAGVPPSVVSSTIKAASCYAAGQAAATGSISVKVVALTEGVLKKMLLSKLKIVVLVVLAWGAITLGGGLSYHIHATEEAAASGPAAFAAPTPSERNAGSSKNDETLKHTLLTLEKARWDANVRQDADALGKLLTEKWVGFSGSDRYSRADYLESIKRQRVAPGYKIHDVELIRLNEKAAILSYKIEYKLHTSNGELLAKRNRRAFVSWVQRGGGWVIACIQDIVIGEERKEPPAIEGETEAEITRVYNVSDLTGKGEEATDDGFNAERLMRIITKTILPRSWAELGGAAAIDYHQETGGLVIRQTPEGHEQIKDLLDALRRVPKKGLPKALAPPKPPAIKP